MNIKLLFRLVQRTGFLLLSSIFVAQPLTAFSQGTAFTYQGRLGQNGSPYDGPAEMRFTLFALPSGGAPMATNDPATASIDVKNGLFTVALDFGTGAFNGDARWLEVAVRTNGASAFTTLVPRQPISAAPYAITAREVTGSLAAEQLIGTIRSANIGDGIIHSNHLAIGSVHSNALVIGSIHSNHLAAGSVHSNALALGSVTAIALAAGSVHSNHLSAGSVHSNALVFGSIHSNHLALGSIHSNHLVLGSIHSNHLAVGSVHSNALALGSVTATALASASIHSNHLAVGSVHSNALVLGSIHSNHLAVGSVHSNALALGSVTAAALAAGSIHSNHLAVGSVHSNALALGTIHSNHLAVGSIHSNHLAVGSVHSNALAFGSVTATALAAGSIHSNHLAAGSVHSNALVVGSIHSNHLAAGSVHSNALAFGSVTATALATGSIHSNHLAAGSVDSSALVVGSIHSNHLAVGAVSLDSLSTAVSSSFPTTVGNPTPGYFEYFGGAVAAVGTDKLLIGEYQDSTGGDNVGAAHLFGFNGSFIRTFLKPAAQNQDHFGIAVAAVGPDHVLIGADADDTGAYDAGAAYLFGVNGALVTVFTNPTPAVADFFGSAVAAVGTDKVLIGAYGDHFGANAGGAAYLFSTNRTLLATFNNPTPSSGDRFGVALAAVGPDHVLIGADRDDQGWTDAGVAYLFHIGGGLVTTFTNPTPALDEAFGFAVAGVGANQVVIGAQRDNSGGNAGGAAYVFNTSGTLLTTIPNPTPASGDQFGFAVAAMGADKVLIGAAADNGGGTTGGSAYLFSTSGALLNTFNNPAPAAGDLFGCAVAPVGPDRVLIGASHDDASPTDSGAAYLFTLNAYVPGLVLDPTFSSWVKSGSDIFYNGGNVGIGTTSPQTTLQVSGNNSQLRLHDTGRGNYWHIYTENHPNSAISGNLLFFPGPSGVFGYIQKSTGTYFSGSDARLKEEVRDLNGVLDRVLQLRPVSYRFKSAPGEAPRTFGLIAQEVEPLFPEVVGEHEGMKSLAYSELVPVTVGAIQELNRKLEQKLEQKETEIAELKARLEKLEQRMNQKHRDGHAP